MSDFTSFFDHHIKGAYSYRFGGESVEQEASIAKGMCKETFGTFLYARPISQALIRVGNLYLLKPRLGLNRLSYRKDGEVVFSPFDYYAYDRRCDCRSVLLSVEVPVFIPDLEVNSIATLAFRLEGVLTHKFADFCKEYLFEVKLADGKAGLVGWNVNRLSATADLLIPLEYVP